MGYIKEIHIKGLKKFKDFKVELNKDINIIVGENGSGKSTIIEALDILINKLYENRDRYILAELFNKELVEKFNDDPTFETLPTIEIIGIFELNSNDKYSGDYYGLNWSDNEREISKYGIRFKCEINRDVLQDVHHLIDEGIIPYEYYSLSWITFKNDSYNKFRKALKFTPIDSTRNSGYNVIDYYTRNIFLNKNEDQINLIKTNFRNKIDQEFDLLDIKMESDNQKFVLNHKKLLLENIVGIENDNILIENLGRGEERVVKTHISLDLKIDNNVIAIEEPEINLSHNTLRKLIKEIEEKCKGKQMIVTTHNNLIVSGLNIKNVIWLADNHAQSLRNVKDKTALYFQKIENNNLLEFILSDNVILVEGPSEKLLLPKMYKQETSTDIDSDKITIISCNGISYKRYLDLIVNSQKKVAALIDNDGNESTIYEAKKQNDESDKTKIFTPNNISEYTWEKSLIDKNRSLIENQINLTEGAKYMVKGQELDDKHLAYMLNNKVKIALKLTTINENIELPKHVEELITWIKE